MHKIIKLFYFIGLVLFSLYISCSKGEATEPEMKAQDMQVPKPVEGTELSGEFVEAAHPTSGQATVNREHTTLKLTNFKTEAGPILEFYLATDLGATDYISLGELKGLNGNYTYTLPANINFTTHKYLMVWCVDFKVDFGHAILE